MPQDRNHQITYLGAILLILGVFLPLASIPVVGDISYYRVASTEAIIVVLFAISAPVLIMLKKAQLTFLSALGAWVTLLWPAIKSMFSGGSDDGGILGKLTKQASDPLADFAAELFTHIDSFSWGGFIFLIGLLTITVGCVMTTRKARG